MKHLLFLAMLSLWLQCADTSQQTSEPQSKTTTNNMDKDKDKNTNNQTKETKKEQSPNYRYTDGNNNTYFITPTSVDYDPMTKEMSSSGVYDGGEPVKKEIDETQYTAIQTAINAAIENTAAHINKRQMGSGLIRAEGKSYKIAYRSKEKAAIEKVLKEVIEAE